MTRKNRLKAKIGPFATHMAAVGDVSRLSIVYILAHGPQDVREIIDITGIPPSLLSHHLKILKEAGWVKRSMFGKRAEYTLETNAFDVFGKLFKDTPLGREMENEKK